MSKFTACFPWKKTLDRCSSLPEAFHLVGMAELEVMLDALSHHRLRGTGKRQTPLV